MNGFRLTKKIEPTKIYILCRFYFYNTGNIFFFELFLLPQLLIINSLVIDDAESFLETGIIVVDDLEILGHIVQVAGDQSLYLKSDKWLGTIVLFFVELDLLTFAQFDQFL